MIPRPSDAARFAATFAALYAAHHLGDYWVQTDHQAATKGAAGKAGRRACAAHVASYTATSTLVLGAVDRALHLRLGWRGLLAGQAVSAITHYLADRREHGALFWLADRVGRSTFLLSRGGGPLLDQAWHIGLGLLPAALATSITARADEEGHA